MNRYRKLNILLLLFTVFSLYAVPQPDVSREIVLQGSYGEVMSISVEPIAAQTQAYRFGMPFDIQDISVQSSAALGRPIAHWSFLSNSSTPFSINVNAEKLTYDGSIETAVPLDYCLTFNYNVSYSIDAEELSYSSSFTHSTDDNPKSYAITYVNGEGKPVNSSDIDLSQLRGSVDGTIFFKFLENQGDKTSEDIISDDDLTPPGNYFARVTLTLEVNE